MDPACVAMPPSSVDASDSNPRRRVTLRDIARRLKISHVTVSYALRGVQRVSPELRKRICDEAARMGYRPDPMLQALSSYRLTSRAKEVRAALAWLCCWNPPEKMHTRKEFHAYWEGAKEVAEKHGYRLEPFAPSPRMSIARIQQIMYARNIKGVLVPPPQSTFSSALGEFDWSRFAVVKFGHSHTSLRTSLVTSAHVYNAMLAMAKMAERGYVRIGFVTSEYGRSHTLFLSGVLRAQVDLPRKCQVPHFCLSEADIAGGNTDRLGVWLKKERPDAVLTNMQEVPGMLRSLGLRIPRDLGLAVFSVHDGNADAGIDQNPLEIGRAACETIISLMLHGSTGIPAHPRELLIEGSWVDGSTLPLRTARQSRRRK